MSHAYARNYIHLTFGTKNRHCCLKPPIQGKLHPYLAGIAREYGVEVLAIEGGEDHVHLLFALPPKLSLAALIRALKANSFKWMNENGHFFAWQQGYGAFSVSASNLQAVGDYIRTQAKHHARHSFEQEFLALLTKHGIEFTPEHAFG